MASTPPLFAPESSLVTNNARRHDASLPSPDPRVYNEYLGSALSSGRRGSDATQYSEGRSIQSKLSSTSMYQSAISTRRTHRPARPQYPNDTDQSHVEFILVASFDIDRGSIMEHQYPTPISGNEHMLAELMLPDQAHNRSQDWTIFFLHKDAGEDGDRASPSNTRRPKYDVEGNAIEGSADGDELSEDEDEDNSNALEGAPLIYVLNLVNTKHDSTVKRGAIVKAMAICTRHPFLHIYKPLLLLALEEYFRSPVPETLASLYDAVNAMDLSLVPRLSLLERIILQASSAKDLFVEKFESMIEQRKVEDALSRRGGSYAILPDGTSVLATNYTLPRDTHEFESKIIYHGISVPVKIPTARSSEVVGDFSIVKLIQTFSAPHSTQPQAFALHPHLTTGGPFTHPIIVLVNALLTQKRIMFIGHNRPSGEVAEAVLASCALASGGLLRGFTRHAFPYTDLTKIDDLLKIPGFIAGVTNPAFANKQEWWDLLCDLPSGRMKISTRLDVPPATEGLSSFQQQNPGLLSTTGNAPTGGQDGTGDGAFMESVLRNINNRLGEGVIRSMWRDWIVKLTRITAAFEESIYGASALYIGGEEADAGAFGVKGHGYVWASATQRQREMAANVHRIEGWRNTRSYYILIQDLAHLYTSRPISAVDLFHHHDRLRTQKLRKDESAAIYVAFEKAIHSQGEICQLLTVTSESHGGLFYIALGLLHPGREVRHKAVALLERIMKHEAGRHFWDSLGRFSKLAFFRIKRDMEGGVAGPGHHEHTYGERSHGLKLSA